MKPHPKSLQNRGFALVVTLSLMILLTIIAVGLLTLSSVSLRASSQGEALATARANARLALFQAIGELQKHAGPDQRITAPANLVDASNPMGITGVWKSWKPETTGVSESDYTDRKSGDNFLGYLLSNSDLADVTPNPKVIPTAPAGGKLSEKLVGAGTLGTNASGREITAPVILTRNGTGTKPQGGYAWVVLDEGVKGRIDLEPATKASSLGEKVALVGAPARNRFPSVKGLEFLESADETELRKELPKFVSLAEAELKSSSPADLTGYFHDYTVSSASLQTNVADGGLKTDLSVVFDGDYQKKLSGDFDAKYLYSNEATPFPDSSSNSDPLWSLYANYSRLYRLNSKSEGSAEDGLVAKLPANYKLKKINDSSGSPTMTRNEPEMKQIAAPVLMPTVVRVDMVFSVVTHKAHAGRNNPKYPYMLHLMYLPVITLHNPYNVPLRCKNFKIEFAEIPIGFRFFVNGQPANTTGNLDPLGNLYVKGSTSKAFAVTLSTSLTNATEVVMAPGETKIFGTPFPSSYTWGQETLTNGDPAKGSKMFDWGDNMTGNLKMIPGMITGPNDGIGFDVDWLVPTNRAQWMKDRFKDLNRGEEGVIMLKDTDLISVEFGPLPRNSSVTSFSMTTSMDGTVIGTTQVAYKNQNTLNTVMAEGTSPRFPESRNFPATFPAKGEKSKSTLNLYEEDGDAFKIYSMAKPFAVFSVGAKTTMEAFTKGRPVADTGIAFQMATCDFRQTTSQGASPLEFALVPVPENGSGAIQSGGPSLDNAFFFGGHGSTNGTTAAAIYEIPLAPLQSIAQLRHANGASLGASPLVTYSVGESRAHPAIPSNLTVFKPDSSKTLLDHAWLANSRLWDGYWFSTLSTLEGPGYQGSTTDQSELAEQFLSGTKALPNPRNTPYFPAGKPADVTDAAADALADNGKSSAAYVMTEGGFNVNSTSVPAWTAVLSALADSDIPLASGTTESCSDVPFPRLRRPVSGAQSSGSDPNEKHWNAYRTLNASEMKTLAERIVDEVRLRGPFLSMADFVNRRIGGKGELTNKGALQAALDKANVNTVMESNARSVTPGEVSTYGWQNSDAVSGNTGAGAPGEISQGDILSAIGSFVSVRSDTFRIRSYGDARDSNGKIIAKAWCEATVQRVPDYVDPADAPEATATSEANVRFGRQFKVVAFRWLSAKEI